MQRAIALALKGKQQTDPNPMVGAILVSQDGTILGEGYHERAGMPHAEVMALQDLETAPANSTLFVTLEPCCHHGKTPPCTDLLIAKKVGKVVIGTLDPNPLVAGQGFEKLRAHGIEVLAGICEKECREINRVFNKHILTGLPFISLKAAASLDGKIAMATGESRWITGEESRKSGHQLRSQHQAIIVGANTLRKDNPRLNDRVSRQPKNPSMVLFSSDGNLPLESNFFQERERERIIFTGNKAEKSTVETLQKAGVSVYQTDTKYPSPVWALALLYKKHGICSALVEGGGELIASFIREGLADCLHLFLSGKIIGDAAAPNWCDHLGIEKLADVPQLTIAETERLGDDLHIVAHFPKQ